MEEVFDVIFAICASVGRFCTDHIVELNTGPDGRRNKKEKMMKEKKAHVECMIANANKFRLRISFGAQSKERSEGKKNERKASKRSQFIDYVKEIMCLK